MKRSMKIISAQMCLGLLAMASFANGNVADDLYCIVDVFGGPQAACRMPLQPLKMSLIRRGSEQEIA